MLLVLASLHPRAVRLGHGREASTWHARGGSVVQAGAALAAWQAAGARRRPRTAPSKQWPRPARADWPQVRGRHGGPSDAAAAVAAAPPSSTGTCSILTRRAAFETRRGPREAWEGSACPAPPVAWPPPGECTLVAAAARLQSAADVNTASATAAAAWRSIAPLATSPRSAAAAAAAPTDAVDEALQPVKTGLEVCRARRAAATTAATIPRHGGLHALLPLRGMVTSNEGSRGRDAEGDARRGALPPSPPMPRGLKVPLRRGR